MTSTLTSLDLRLVEAVLQMEEGYVLDFTDRTFTEFFRDFGVDIDDARFCVDGTSKAKRLRRFLRTSEPGLVGRVLGALLEHRLASSSTSLLMKDQEGYQRIVERIVASDRPGPEQRDARNGLLGRAFEPALFDALPLDPSMTRVLRERMEEAQACLHAGAHLAAVILSGSVLEGLCLGYGQRNVQRVNEAFREVIQKKPPSFDSWSLAQWIRVLCHLRCFSPNIDKFGHAVREFRNYVHPHQQLESNFSPDHNTALIAFQVVIAAAEELSRHSPAEGAPSNG